MAVKKGILDNFLNPTSHSLYRDNKKDLKSIFIDKNEDDLKPEPKGFLDLEEISLGNDKGTIREPLENDISDSLGNDKGTKPKHEIPINTHKGTIRVRIREHNKGTIREPLGNKEYDVTDLSGIQRAILFYIVDVCAFRGELTTPNISNQTLRSIANTTADSIKTSIKRLISKKFVKRKGGKRGNGGGTPFIITAQIRDLVLREIRLTKNISLGNGLGDSIREPLGDDKGTIKGTNALNSSSSNLIKETTTTEIPDEWAFDITPYQIFGFGKTQIKQLIPLAVNPMDVEESLVHLKHDLDNCNPVRLKPNILHGLMGILRKGNKYISVSFIDEEEKTILEMARLAKEKNDRLMDAKFLAWVETTSDDELERIVGVRLVTFFRQLRLNSKEVKEQLMEYFKANVLHGTSK